MITRRTSLKAAGAVARDGGRGIVFGGSGQGEAMVANRVHGVRAAVFYGFPQKSAADAQGSELDIIQASRAHNDANILSIGARYVTSEEVLGAVDTWLKEAFSEEEHHKRRIGDIERCTEGL